MKNFKNKKAFTLVEMITAIAVLVIMIGFTSVIFRTSIDSYRTANANAEIMQKLRAITDTLDRDFANFQPSGRLIIKNQIRSKRVYETDPLSAAEPNRMDTIYYYAVGDYQSWYDSTTRAMAARIFIGHDLLSLSSTGNIPLSKGKLLRDVLLLTQGIPSPYDDSNGVSLAACTQNRTWLCENDPNTTHDAIEICNYSFPVDIQTHPEDVRRLFAENVGEMKIEWAWGVPFSTRYLGSPTGFDWKPYPIELPAIAGSELLTEWSPYQVKPKALKFTFTLYDSKGILKGGRRFSHIVYLGNN
jgi:prepilin-type N-terminal cleavage/methylation domain-containing protein